MLLIPQTNTKIPDDVRRNISCAQPIMLHPAEIIRRFASSTRPGYTHCASPWWIRDHDFRALMEQHANSNMTLGFDARVALAIKQSWNNRLDRLVTAYVGQELPAFIGYGRAQRHDYAPNGAHIVYQPSRAILQLYIAGLSEKDGTPTPLARQSLTLVSSTPIPSHQLTGVVEHKPANNPVRK